MHFNADFMRKTSQLLPWCQLLNSVTVYGPPELCVTLLVQVTASAHEAYATQGEGRHKALQGIRASSITYMWTPKYDANKFIFKTETDSQTYRTDLWLPKGKGSGGGKNWEFGLAEANYYIENGQTTRSYCIAQGTLFSIL